MQTMSQKIEATLFKLRAKLREKGPFTVRSLGKVFRQLDSFDGNNHVDTDEFLVGLRELGIMLKKEESDTLLAALDRNNDGVVDFEEFLAAVRGQMNARRQALVDKAFLKFDKEGLGIINSKDLRGVYNCSQHPKVQNGQMTEEQVFIEFLQNFGNSNKDGKITRQVEINLQEWNDYYAAVSGSIESDDHFVKLMKLAWKLD